jgi:hypothetical protein
MALCSWDVEGIKEEEDEEVSTKIFRSENVFELCEVP